MSRTDAHRPFWVQVQDPAMRRHLVAAHHHWVRDLYDPVLKRHLVAETRPCNLDNPREPGCAWWPAGGGNIFCGCHMCTGQDGRRRARRTERTTLRTQTRNALAVVAAGCDDVDIPPPGPVTTW